ncbi:MAG: type I restriction enzyme HsdR N-terminal domain-containing protein [Symploca sp. SIO1B1]|nr:type I restriction enzyme HsdR N-terminal domain-containing protein [Symploca sp. SIO1A3]NER93802.1 type I restriction enzyme HsdR N-terminal domain-containing protein [Symploca sp. SIO1B1]
MIYPKREGIDPRDWLKQANFPSNWKELDLQQWIADRLRSQGYDLKEGVWMDLPGGGKGQADIVLYYDGKPWQVLEVKKIINREGVLLGTNQARAYTSILGATEQPLLMGLAPWSEKEYWSGKNAINLSAHNQVGIIFLNEDDRWFPAPNEGIAQTQHRDNNFNFQFKLLNLGLINSLLSNCYSLINRGINKLNWKKKAIAIITLCFISFLLSWFHGSKAIETYRDINNNNVQEQCR